MRPDQSYIEGNLSSWAMQNATERKTEIKSPSCTQQRMGDKNNNSRVVALTQIAMNGMMVIVQR